MSLHKAISYIKSTVRLFGYAALSLAFPLSAPVFFACLVLVISEIIGILEEVGEK